MRLNTLQEWLERLYDLGVEQRVEDFIFSGRETLEALLGDGPTAAHTPEMLLISEDGEDLELSLFFAEELLERLASDSPAQTLHDANLGTLLTAIEGVSHFLYVVWNAARGRPVTQLELEIQAEVDKFVLSRLLARQHYGPAVLRPLREALFRRFRLHEHLCEERRSRYLRANSLAARYCTALDGRSGHWGCPPPVRSELRRFYRLGQSDKIRHIHAAASMA